MTQLAELVQAIQKEALAATPFVAAELEKALEHLELAAPCPRGQHRDEKTGRCRPANAKERAAAAAMRKDDRLELGWIVPIAKVDEERQLVASVVYEPGVEDAHGDAMTAAEIERSCHGFGIRYAQGRGELGTDHARKAKRLELVPVENFLAPVDFHLGKQLVTKGSWVMWSKVLDPDLWTGIKSGDYTGYSFEGYGRRVPGN